MENKTSKYLKYAIGEIVLVVIGILIALEINNWNEDRKLKIQEHLYLNRLLIENNEDILTFEAGIRDLEKGIETIENLSNGLKKLDISDSSLINLANDYFKFGSIYPIFSSSTSTFDDLSSTGNLKVIRNSTLRDRLVKHYAKHKQVAERIRIGTDWALPVDAPFTYEHNIMRFEPSTALLFKQTPMNDLAKDLRDNSVVYINNAAAHFWINKDAINYLETLKKETNIIVKLLEDELKP